jgi:hypothetical protein
MEGRVRLLYVEQRSPSLLLARRLIEREAASANGGGAVPDGVALQRACARVLDALGNSMGEEGRNALLTRALSRAEGQHPALRNIRRLSGGGIHMEGVTATVETHPVVEVTAAVEALLGALVDVLGRLIGEDMAIRILDGDISSHNGDKAPGS